METEKNNITKEEFLKLMIFNNQDEEKHCNKYLDLKGIQYHYFFVELIGLSENGKIEYSKVSDMYRYDKKIRNVLYKYISSLEEKIRAYIANNYKLLKNKIPKSNKKITISENLQELNFGKLIEKFLKLDNEFTEKVFPNQNGHLKENLLAVKILRNVVSHHKILFNYSKFDKCYYENKTGDKLKDNIINLLNLIDDYYKKYFIDNINNAIFSKRENRNLDVPNKYIINLEE